MRIIAKIVLVANAMVCACSCHSQEPGGLPWEATVKVVDEFGGPVGGADVTVGYYTTPTNGQEIATGSTKGRTDTNGVFSVAGRTLSVDLFFGVGKEGYYRSHLDHELGAPYQYTRAKWSPAVTLPLRKIGNPIPMFAKRFETKVQRENEPVGLDLAAGGWVAPHGPGKSSDLLFAVSRKVTGDNEYDAEVTLTFPNKGDGIAVAPPEPDRGSEFKTSRSAPETGYEPQRTWHYSNSAGPEPVFGYFVRVRTVLDANGNVKSAFYGKIAGDLRFYVGTRAPRAGMGFTYYLNPTPNDRNLEFDPKRNLLKGLKAEEQVNAP